MLAVHLLWTDDGGGGLLLWGEDGELPEGGPATRGRKPAGQRSQDHPFAADLSTLSASLTGAAPSLHGALADGKEDHAVLWLPGTSSSPRASPQLVRSSSGSGAAKPRAATRLWPFGVPVLRLGPSPGLDVASALATSISPDLHTGDSVSTFAVLAALALEIGAAGRVLPNLRLGVAGHEARWEPLLNVADEERVGALARSLPAICRALTADGDPPEGIVRHALGAFVDAVCRDSLVSAPGSVMRLSRGSADGTSSAIEAWLVALTSPSHHVIADPAELATLELPDRESR